MAKVYLAGPDIFYEDALKIGKEKKAICAKNGLEAVWPLDWQGLEKTKLHPSIIYTLDVAAIRDCDAVLANIDPFRGPSCDVGTAVEIGYAAALLKPVFGYTKERYASQCYKARWGLIQMYMDDAHFFDVEEGEQLFETGAYREVEDFGLVDNLMVVEPLRKLCFSFEEAVTEAANFLLGETENN